MELLAYAFIILRLRAPAAAPVHSKKKLEGSGAEIKGVVASAKFPPIAVKDWMALQLPVPGVGVWHVPSVFNAHPPPSLRMTLSRSISKMLPSPRKQGESLHPERYISVTPPITFDVQLPNALLKQLTANVPTVSISRVKKPLPFNLKLVVPPPLAFELKVNGVAAVTFVQPESQLGSLT
jgi:hypothetical protein